MLTPPALFEKVIPAIQETWTYCHIINIIIHTIIFTFTDGEGLSVDFR